MLKIAFWKKKLPNLPKNTENPRFFGFQKNYKMAGIVRNWPISTSKVPACSKFLPEIFCWLRTKNSWNYSKNATPYQKGHFRKGGGGRIIKCQFPQVSLNMHKRLKMKKRLNLFSRMATNGQKTLKLYVFRKL